MFVKELRATSIEYGNVFRSKETHGEWTKDFICNKIVVIKIFMAYLDAENLFHQSSLHG